MAFGIGSGFAVFAMFDVTNAEALLPLFPRLTTHNVIGQADLAIGAGSNVVLTAQIVAAHTTLEVINPNAAPIRVGFGPVSATQGILLNPSGSAGDRIRFGTKYFALQELRAWKLTAGTILVLRSQ